MKRRLAFILSICAWSATSVNQVLPDDDIAYRTLRTAIMNIEWSRRCDMSVGHIKELVGELEFYSGHVGPYADLVAKVDSMLSYYKFQYTWR